MDAATGISASEAMGAGLARRLDSHRTQRDGVQAVRDFEALLLHRLMQEMKATIPDSPLMDDSVGKQFEDLFWMYLAQDLGDKGGLGICRQLYQQVARQQDPQPAGRTECLR